MTCFRMLYVVAICITAPHSHSLPPGWEDMQRNFVPKFHQQALLDEREDLVFAQADLLMPPTCSLDLSRSQDATSEGTDIDSFPAPITFEQTRLGAYSSHLHGHEAFQRQDYKAAIGFYGLALNHSEWTGLDKATTHFNLGDCYFALGEHQLGEDHYRKGFSTPETQRMVKVHFYKKLALELQTQNRFSEANTILQKRLEVLETAHIEEGEEWQGYACKYETLYYLGLGSKEAGESNVAIQYFQAIPKTSDAYFHLAQIELALIKGTDSEGWLDTVHLVQVLRENRGHDGSTSAQQSQSPSASFGRVTGVTWERVLGGVESLRAMMGLS